MGLSANDYTTDEKNKLEGIATGAEVNIQPDWNETNRKSSAFIKNKPKSMPASDVYDWAKSPLKPSYGRSEGMYPMLQQTIRHQLLNRRRKGIISKAVKSYL